MNTPHFASVVAKLLGKHLRPTTAHAGDRERGIATIERALRARARRRTTTWAVSGIALAAAAVLSIQAARWARGSSTLVSIDVSPAGRGAALSSGNQALPMHARAELEAGQRIDTPAEGAASLRLSTGTSMDLAGRTSFRVDSQGATEHFSLQRGQLSAHVAKLMPGQRFIVATPDAEVEVRGTRFQLSVIDEIQACGSDTRTRLDVSEGVVEVRAAGVSTRVAAGERWPADCPNSAAERPSNADRAPAMAAPAKSEPERSPTHLAEHKPAAAGLDPAPRTPIPVSSTSAAPDPASALSQQNDLFAKAVLLRQQGDLPGALHTYQDLISRFPKSPLAENALVERMRLMARSGGTDAQSEAKRYIARYPNGFAAAEARRISGSP